MRVVLVFLLVLAPLLPAFAQKVKSVECEYVYHAPENMTLENAKRTALERAQIQAIANEFGTVVSQTNITNLSGSGVDFQAIGMSEVKGEWIEDIDKPVYNIEFDDGLIVITVRVKGKVRETMLAKADCVARVLRNGKEDRFESDKFFDGDQFYISFYSPSNGYITVYLSDNKGDTFCLLPYPSQQEANFPVSANWRYLLFDQDEGDIYTEEYTFTCASPPENNQIYVIFSPNKFTKALDNKTSEQLPRVLSNHDFQKWLAKCRRQDPEMQVIRKYITINHQ